MTKFGPPSYLYQATVLAVHDGDTFKLDVDLGPWRHADQDFGMHVFVEGRRLKIHETVRLARCNAPELATPEGQVALGQLLAMMPVGTAVIAQTHVDETEKYGRLLAEVTLPDGSNVTDRMIAGGWAAPWDGHGPKPVPTG